MSVPSCCLKGFSWSGQPTGQISKLGNHDTYLTGSNPDIAVLIIHDLYGWTFTNVRLLADHYAQEANVTVYIPDLFHGEGLPLEPLLSERWGDLDLPRFMSKNSREIREPEIFDSARELRKQYKKVGVIGFCYGGWASFRLGAKEHQPPLVDCVSLAHPSLLKKKDIDEIAVPIQILAPEIDHVFTPELKSHAFETIMKLGVPFDYQHFPGVHHACMVRGDEKKPGEREAMARGKNAVVNWFIQYLHNS